MRFVQLFNGAYAMGEGVGNWDGHKKIAEAVSTCHADQFWTSPAAALIADLKRRGLLVGNAGRDGAPSSAACRRFRQGASGRDHNPAGFTAMALPARASSRLSAYGATDEFGYEAVEDVASVHDLHATLLHLLGLDHRRLTFYHNGLQRRLTDVHGEVIEAILT